VVGKLVDWRVHFFGIIANKIWGMTRFIKAFVTTSVVILMDRKPVYQTTIDTQSNKTIYLFKQVDRDKLRDSVSEFFGIIEDQAKFTTLLLDADSAMLRYVIYDPLFEVRYERECIPLHPVLVYDNKYSQMYLGLLHIKCIDIDITLNITFAIPTIILPFQIKDQDYIEYTDIRLIIKPSHISAFCRKCNEQFFIPVELLDSYIRVWQAYGAFDVSLQVCRLTIDTATEYLERFIKKIEKVTYFTDPCSGWVL